MTALSPRLGEIGNLIFLSYRRDDTAAQTLALRLELGTRLRAAQIFLDTHEIRYGPEWPEQVKDALRVAKVVIAVIGDKWLGESADRPEDRRIDKPEDWVHREIALALQEKPRAIIPILIDEAPKLETIPLPDSIKALAPKRYLRLRRNEWDTDIKNVAETLKSDFQFELKDEHIRLPPRDRVKELCQPLDWKTLERVRTEALPQWRIEFSDDPDRVHHKRLELVRDFEFPSFERAMEFMAAVAKFASESNHHPRWMNLWNTVRVWLSTWDVGSRITLLDTQFARYMDRKSREYQVLDG